MFLPFEAHLPAGGGHQAQDGAAHSGLAAARLAHQAQRLAAADEEADVVHGLDPGNGALKQAAAHREELDQAVHFQQDVVLRLVALRGSARLAALGVGWRGRSAVGFAVWSRGRLH